MTEGDWLTGTDPAPMLDVVRDRDLSVLRDSAYDAIEGLGGVVGVEGAEDQAAGLGHGQGDLDGLEVAHLADHQHVGVLPEGGEERFAPFVTMLLAPPTAIRAHDLLVHVGRADKLDRDRADLGDRSSRLLRLGRTGSRAGALRPNRSATRHQCQITPDNRLGTNSSASTTPDLITAVPLDPRPRATVTLALLAAVGPRAALPGPIHPGRPPSCWS